MLHDPLPNGQPGEGALTVGPRDLAAAAASPNNSNISSLHMRRRMQAALRLHGSLACSPGPHAVYRSAFAEDRNEMGERQLAEEGGFRELRLRRLV